MRLPEDLSSDTKDWPTTSNPLQSTETSQETDEQRYDASFSFYALAALTCIITPALIFIAWRIVRSWSWWRIAAAGRGQESREGLSHANRQYIRTWHGWVDRSKDLDRREKRRQKEQRNLRVRQHIASAGSDWVGLPQIRPLRPSRPPSPPATFGALLQRAGGFSHGTTTYEANSSKRRRQTAQLLKEARKYDGAEQIDGADNVENTTVQERGSAGVSKLRRKISNQHGESFSKSLSYAPRRPSLANLFQEKGAIPAKEPAERVRFQRISNVDHIGLSAGIGVVSGTRQDIGDARLYRNRSASRRFKSPLLDHMICGHVRPGNRRPTPSQGPEAPANSQATVKDNQSGLKDYSLLTSGYNAKGSPDSIRTAIERSLFSISVESLCRRLELFEAPMFVDCFVQKPRTQNGILGRRPSPAMSWRRLPDIKPSVQESKEDEEDEKVSKASVRSSESALFIASFRPSQINASKKSKFNIPNLDGVNSRPPSKSPEPTLNGQGKLPFVEPLKQKTNPRQRPTLQKTKSCAFGPASPQIKAIRQSRPPVSRSAPLPVVPRINNSAGSSDKNIQYEDLPTSEKAFFHDLYRKLHWLQYELSAGFRETDENTADLLFTVHSGAMNPNSRAPEDVRKRALAGDPHPRSKSHTLEEKPRVPVPDIELWRIDINRSRRNQQADAAVELLKRPLRRPVSFEAIDVDEDKIDTAAWIIRRPPGGIPRSTEEAKAVPYTKPQLTIRRHNDWEKVRRPEMVKLARKGSIAGK
jgi:hypothetical protein